MEAFGLELEVGGVVLGSDLFTDQLALRGLEKLYVVRGLNGSVLSLWDVDGVTSSLLQLDEVVTADYESDERVCDVTGFVHYFDVGDNAAESSEQLIFLLLLFVELLAWFGHRWVYISVRGGGATYGDK